MYRVKNSYGGCQLLDLNMMGMRRSDHVHFSSVELFMFVVPVIVLVAALIVPVLSDMTFMAQCQNVPGGDVCSISFDKV